MAAMIVVAGEALIDRIVRPDGSAAELPGGGPFNTARTIGRLAVPVAFLGRLSSDQTGVILRRALHAAGVDLSMVEATEAPTTVAIAELDDAGAATYRFLADGTSAAGLDRAALRTVLEANPAAVHLGSLGLVLEPIGSTLSAGIGLASPETLVVLDPNCRPPAIADRAGYLDRIDDVLQRTDLVKASRDDLSYLRPGVSIDVAVREILAAGPRAVLVTDGPGPVACHTRDFTFDLPVPRIATVDTVGAGDAFGGAFLARWIELGFGRDELADEASLRAALRLAIEVASRTCLRSGADPPLRDELDWPVD